MHCVIGTVSPMRRSNLTIGVYRTWALAATVVAALLAIGLIVALVAELASPEWGWRWGSAGEWVGGIGGLLAFLTALGIAYVERNRHRRTIAAASVGRSCPGAPACQPHRIRAPWSRSRPDSSALTRDVYGDAPDDHYVHLENRSAAPIFEIVASLSYADHRLEPQTVDLVWFRPGDRGDRFRPDPRPMAPELESRTTGPSDHLSPPSRLNVDDVEMAGTCKSSS